MSLKKKSLAGTNPMATLDGEIAGSAADYVEPIKLKTTGNSKPHIMHKNGNDYIEEEYYMELDAVDDKGKDGATRSNKPHHIMHKPSNGYIEEKYDEINAGDKGKDGATRSSKPHHNIMHKPGNGYIEEEYVEIDGGNNGVDDEADHMYESAETAAAYIAPLKLKAATAAAGDDSLYI